MKEKKLRRLICEEVKDVLNERIDAKRGWVDVSDSPNGVSLTVGTYGAGGEHTITLNSSQVEELISQLGIASGGRLGR